MYLLAMVLVSGALDAQNGAGGLPSPFNVFQP